MLCWTRYRQQDELASRPTRPAAREHVVGSLVRRCTRALSFLVFSLCIGSRSARTFCWPGRETVRRRNLASSFRRQPDRCGRVRSIKSGSTLAAARSFRPASRDHCWFFGRDGGRDPATGLGNIDQRPDLDGNRIYSFGDCEPAKGTEASVLALGAILSPLADQLPPAAPHELLREFGSISGITNASEAQLRRLLGQQNPLVDTLMVCRNLIDAALQEQIERSPLDPLDTKMRQYLAIQLGLCRHERMVAIFGDSRGHFITIETVAKGGVDRVAVSSRLLFARAMSLDARFLILAHNHPSGCANPSQEDVLATQDVGRLGESLGVSLIDHLIIARGQVISMRDRGLL